MSGIVSTEMAGSIIRRVREDRGVSRAELAKIVGIGARTLYALETGESENFGLGNYLRLLDALGLTMEISVADPLRQVETSQEEGDGAVPWAQREMALVVGKLPKLDDRWAL